MNVLHIRIPKSPCFASNLKKNKKEKRVNGGSTLDIFSGRRMPALVLEGGTIFSTRMRLNKGIKRFAMDDLNQKAEMGGRGSKGLEASSRSHCVSSPNLLVGFRRDLVQSEFTPMPLLLLLLYLSFFFFFLE